MSDGRMTQFSLIRTSFSRAPEAGVFAGGSLRRRVTINYAAVLVENEGHSLLFDSGLGREVDAQVASDMPFWKRPLLAYGPVDPVRTQLERANHALPERLVLSHGHWDHASGVVDFPDAEIWATREEREFLAHVPGWFSIKRGGTMPSQVTSPAIRWHEYTFADRPYDAFAQSLDLFGNGSVVLVPLFGHTPGSIGMFVTVTSGKRFFFCGDAVWNERAIADARPKAPFMRQMVDSDCAAAQANVELLRDLAKRDPATTIVPAHDGHLQDRIGYFPAFVT
jgi:glyoxylase-like metal-dependent hydrolase (beta-lactamase superfamily II)